MTIGTRIKELRVKRGLTQDQIAVKLGMDRANFSHYERDTAIPPSDTLGKIADELNTSADYLLGRGGEPMGDPIKGDIKDIELLLFVRRIATLEAKRGELVNEITKLGYPKDESLVNAYAMLEDAFKNVITSEAQYLASLK
ncbi:MAG: helix-turn-helix transcriptional regulator [Desulfosporosinus sp.]